MNFRPFAVAGLTLVATTAAANGRFPASSSIAIQDGHSDHILIGTTFGPVISTDNGMTWIWVCDQSVGNVTALDPIFFWTSSGTILAAAWEGLLITADNGCNWSGHPFFATTNPPGPHQGTSGMAQSPSDPNTFFVTTSRNATGNGLFVTHDGAQTFAPTALVLDNVYFTSVAIAPSDANRIYVAGWWFQPLDGGSLYEGWMYVSRDGGKTFATIPQPVPTNGSLHVLGVSPVNPDVVLGYTQGYANGANVPVSNIIRSTDATATFTTVKTISDQVRNLAISDDGSTMWLATLDVFYRSTDTGLTFTPLSAPHPNQNGCVYRNSSTLYACGWPWTDGFAVGTSTDGGSNFSKLFTLTDLQGLESCPAGSTTTTLCAGQWDLLASLLGITPDAGGTAGPKSGCHCGPFGFAPATSPIESVAYLWLGFWIRRLRRTRSRSETR